MFTLYTLQAMPQPTYANVHTVVSRELLNITPHHPLSHLLVVLSFTIYGMDWKSVLRINDILVWIRIHASD